MPATVDQDQLSLDEAKKITDQPGGIYRLLALVRDGRVSNEVAIELINAQERRLSERSKRVVIALVEGILGR